MRILRLSDKEQPFNVEHGNNRWLLRELDLQEQNDRVFVVEWVHLAQDKVQRLAPEHDNNLSCCSSALPDLIYRFIGIMQ